LILALPVLVLVPVVVVVTLFVLGDIFEPETLEIGRREIRAMKSDPVVRFRAPRTALLNQEEHPAARHPFGGGQSTSSIRQTFDMSAEPGEAVEAYRLAAQANGWAFVADGCSRVEGATAAVFGKRFDGFDATLVVHAQLDRNPALDGQYGEPGHRGLLVSLDATQAGIEDLSVDAGIKNNDVQCLRRVDPSDPDLHPPAPPSLTMEELCSRMPVPALQTVVAQVQGVLLQATVEECWLVDASRRPLLIVEHARHPRAFYEDRQLPSAQASPETFSFSVHGKKDPDRATSVWATTASGSYVVSPGGVLVGEQGTEDLLFAVARLLRGIDPRPAPGGPPTTVVPESNAGTLVEYALDGGIAGTMRLVVTTDGQAVYTGGTPQEIRFPVPPGTMDELRAALSGVDFGRLSPSYGSASGPDSQVQVIRYQGKTVRVFSGGPSELRRVTTILNRLLDEGRRRR